MEKNTFVILENISIGEKVQLELSDSALRLLYYLSDNEWIDNSVIIMEIDKTGFERFV
jgi:hypothetical protein